MGIVHQSLLATFVVGALAWSGASFAAPVGAAPMAAAAGSVPPTARTVDVVERPFGLTLSDPYRWMEGSGNAEFDAWLKAHGEDTREKLDALPTLAAWRERLRKVSGATVFNGAFRRSGGKVFFVRLAGAAMPALLVSDGKGNERVLIDPATLKDGATIQGFSPSPDGKLVAVNVGLGAGMELSHIRVIDAETLQWLPDAVEPVWGEFTANWLPDGSGFTYTQIAPESDRPGGDPLQNMRARLHVLGTAAAEDPILLRAGEGEGGNPAFKLASNEFPMFGFVPGSRWAVAVASGARPELRLCVAPFDEAVKPGANWRSMVEFTDGVRAFALRGDSLYLVSVHGYPNGRVLALDLSKTGATLRDARVVMPMVDDAVVSELATARDALYVKRMRNGIDELVRVDYVSEKTAPLAIPVAGMVTFDASPRADGVVLKVRGWTTPGIGYASSPGAGTLRELGIRDESPADYGMVTSVETEAVSRDGTRVPLSIIHRKDIRLDGRHRALVGAYGGYGMSMQPVFDPVPLEWVKAGGVYAVCHVRGGGEKGDAWHRGGQGANKHKGVEDFVACAGELARKGYTTPAHTGLQAMSMGGVLIGGAVTAHPNRFGAALVDVGIVNPVRILAAENGANQIGELGDPRTADGMQAIAAMDPYHRVKPGTKYPAVLFQVGLRDSRVAPWMTGKFAARLLAADAGGRPIWIRTDAAEGHFAFSLGGAAELAADQYAFLDANLPVD